jgi:hypothetical protein
MVDDDHVAIAEVIVRGLPRSATHVMIAAQFASGARWARPRVHSMVPSLAR